MHNEHILQTLCLAVFLGILSQFLFRKCKIPTIIFLLFFGIMAGPEVLHLLYTDQLTDITTALTSVGVAVILFEGGMSLNISDLKLAPKATFNIFIIGPFITLFTIGACLHYILSINWEVSFLTGSILVVSGPAVVASLLVRARINKNLKDILTWESIIVEATGGVLMVVVLHFILSGSDSHLETVLHFLERLAIGIVSGYLTGKFLKFLIPRRIISHDILNLAILGILLLAFWIANHFASESGLLTAVVAGLMVGQLRHPAQEEIREFKEQLTTLIISVVFILLASRLELNNFTQYGWEMVLAIVAILFLARPLMIFITTIRTGLNFREKLFLVWVSPRGVFAAATASLFTIVLVEHHFPQAEILETVVFLVIFSTVVLQGLTIGPVARLLKVIAPPRDGYLLVGIHQFSIEIAKLIKQEGIPVKLIDNKEDFINKAKEEGLEVVNCNIMDEEELEAIGLERMGTMLAITDNDETNTLVCRLGRKLFGLDNAYQVVNTFLSDITDDVLLNFGGLLAFDMKMSINTVNERLLSGRLKVEKLHLKRSGKGYELPDNFLFSLFFLQNGKVTIAQEDDKIKTPTLIAITMA